MVDTTIFFSKISNLLPKNKHYLMWAFFASMGQNLFCYTKACELMGKGVGIGLVGLYCRLACAQAKHAQDKAENAAASRAL